MWAFLIVPIEQDFIQTSGSLLFLPAAGRILPVLFFGIRTLPAILLSSLIAWNFLWPYEITLVRNLGLIISFSSVLLAWIVFRYLDTELSYKGKLKPSNWRHLILFILLCGLLNGLLVGAYYSNESDVLNPLISLRFFVGDVTGTIFILIFAILVISAFHLKRIS